MHSRLPHHFEFEQPAAPEASTVTGLFSRWQRGALDLPHNAQHIHILLAVPVSCGFVPSSSNLTGPLAAATCRRMKPRCLKYD